MCSSPGARATVACLLLSAALFASTARAARQEPDAAAAQQQQRLNGGVRVTDPHMLKALSDAEAAAGQPRLFHENLVKSRPLVRPNGTNWYSYNYSVFTNADRNSPGEPFLGLATVERGNLPAGVLNMTLEWKPMKGLTSEMVEWMFGNLHKTALSPFDNKTYPMYTILHPTDHITFLAQPADRPVARGSTFTFIENPGSGCIYQPDSRDAPFVCPSNRTGFTVDTPEAVWRAFPQTNATLVVDRLDRHNCVWYKERVLPHFGRRAVIASKMSWEDTPAGLVLRASRLAGVMAPNATAHFETRDPELLAQANEVVRVAYLDGNFGGNITASAYAFGLHWGQEWTGLKDWLPQVWASAKQLQAAERRAAETAADDDTEDAAAASRSVPQTSAAGPAASGAAAASFSSVAALGCGALAAVLMLTLH